MAFLLTLVVMFMLIMDDPQSLALLSASDSAIVMSFISDDRPLESILCVTSFYSYSVASRLVTEARVSAMHLVLGNSFFACLLKGCNFESNQRR